jgi:quaternary ammonium compound-resistance protein SugE
MAIAWIYLLCAGLLEVCWAIGLKYTDGFTRMYLLAKAAQTLPIGTAYAAWVGIGALGAAVLGIFIFQESASILRISFLIMLLISIIGLKFTSGV